MHVADRATAWRAGRPGALTQLTAQRTAARGHADAWEGQARLLQEVTSEPGLKVE